MNSMRRIKYIALFLLGQFFISSCNKDNQVIENELQIHFTNFEAEAIAHGINIDISSIDIGGYIQNIETRGTLGQCKSYSDGSQQVIVDEEYWNNISDAEREYLVFHELGHCLLEKEHNDEKDENGNCISIMQSGNNDCKGEYNSDNRDNLLFELFSN